MAENVKIQHHLGNDAAGAAAMLVLFLACGWVWSMKKQTMNISYDPARRELRGIEWDDTPKTDLAVELFKYDERMWQEWVKRDGGVGHPPVHLVAVHRITNTTVCGLNKLNPKWWAFPVIGFLPLFLILPVHLAGRFTKTPSSIFWAALSFAGVGLLGTTAAFPVVHGWLMWLGKWALLAAQVVTTAAAGVLCITRNKRSTEKKLKYGPIFRPPMGRSQAELTTEDGVEVGEFDGKLLPDHTRWISDRGRDGVIIPYDKLSCGVTILGEKGSGKSRLMFALHKGIREKYPQIPVLIHDPKGEWYRTYYNPKTDVIFAPHFENSSAWDLWSDLKTHPELLHEAITTAVYAHHASGDTFWADNAVSLLRAAFSCEDLAAARDYLVAKKEASADDKTFLSIYSTMKLGFLDIVKIQLDAERKRGKPGPKTIDDYLAWPGRIFLLNNPSCASEQHGAFNLFLSMFLLRALSLPDVAPGTLKLVTFIDEALTFHVPADVERRIYTQCRSKGMCIIAGAQRLPDGRMRETGEWATAEYLFGMKVFNQDTQTSLSKRGGELHYDEKTKSSSRNDVAGQTSKTEGEQERRHAALPPEYFGRLGNRESILFHEHGIAPCRSVKVDDEQRDMAYPKYDARPEVVEFASSID